MGAFSQDAELEAVRTGEDPAEHYTTTVTLHRDDSERLKAIGAAHYRQRGLSPMLRQITRAFIAAHDAAEAATSASASEEVAA
jgi:hypothetical protein